MARSYVQPGMVFPDSSNPEWMIGVLEDGSLYMATREGGKIYLESTNSPLPTALQGLERIQLNQTGLRGAQEQVYTKELELINSYAPKSKRPQPELFFRLLQDQTEPTGQDAKDLKEWRAKLEPMKNQTGFLFWGKIQEDVQTQLAESEAAEAEKAAAAEAAKAAVEAAAPTEEARKAQIARLQKGAYERSQKQDLSRALGPMALVGGIGSAVQVVSAFRPDLVGDVQDKYVAEELKKKPIGGLPPAQRAFMERVMMAPVRGLATERRKRREAEMAASGQRSSAAELEEARTAESRDVGKAAQITGAKIADANMKAAAQELQRREQMIAYQGQRQRQKLAAAGKGAMQVAGLVGAARAGKATPVMDPTKLVENLQDNNVPEEEIDDIVEDIERAYRLGKPPSRRRLTRILKDYNIKIDDLDQATVSRLTGSDFLRQQERRQGGFESAQGGPLGAPSSPGGRLQKLQDEKALAALFAGEESGKKKLEGPVALGLGLGETDEQDSHPEYPTVYPTKTQPFYSSWEGYGKETGMSQEQWEAQPPMYKDDIISELYKQGKLKPLQSSPE